VVAAVKGFQVRVKVQVVGVFAERHRREIDLFWLEDSYARDNFMGEELYQRANDVVDCEGDGSKYAGGPDHLGNLAICGEDV